MTKTEYLFGFKPDSLIGLDWEEGLALRKIEGRMLINTLYVENSDNYSKKLRLSKARAAQTVNDTMIEEMEEVDR